MALPPQAAAPSNRTLARVAGWAYVIPVALIVYANFGLRGPLFVNGDIAETLRRMAASETRFRISIAFDVAYCIGVVVLLTALYSILSTRSRYLALLAATLKGLYAITAVLTPITLLAQFRLASDPALTASLGVGPLQGVARLISALWWPEYYVGLAFWAVSATIFAWLWLTSRLIPRPLAVYGVATATWCVACAFAYLVNPGFGHVVNAWLFDAPMLVFELAAGVWLLIRGLGASSSTVGDPVTTCAPDASLAL